jgi:hypothetical protein
VSGEFIPQQLTDVLVEENIAGLTESDESDDEFDDVLYSLIIIHTGDLFTIIQQAGKSLHLQKQILLNLPGISNLCKSTLELG